MSNFLIGLEVIFERNGYEIKGTIQKNLEKSVIVEVSQEDAKRIDLPNCLTVVNHNNYRFIS